jgi:hypothetical protein
VTRLQTANAMLEPGASQQDRERYANWRFEVSSWSAENDAAVDALFGDFLQMDQKVSNWASLRWHRFAARSRQRGLRVWTSMSRRPG